MPMEHAKCSHNVVITAFGHTTNGFIYGKGGFCISHGLDVGVPIPFDTAVAAGSIASWLTIRFGFPVSLSHLFP